MNHPYVSAVLRGFQPIVQAVDPALAVNFEISFNDESRGQEVHGSIPNGSTNLSFHLLSIQGALFYGGKEAHDLDGFLTLGAAIPPFSAQSFSEQRSANHSTVVFPLTYHLVNKIEEMRKGDDARLRVVMRVSGLLEATVGPQHVMQAIVLDRLPVNPNPHDHSAVLRIAKSEWVETILPQLKFGKFKLYEVPWSESSSMAGVDGYIEDAFTQFNTGNYKRCVGACRDAVEAMKEVLQGTINPVFTDPKATAEAKVDRVREAFTKLASSMLDFEATLTSLMAAGAHPRPPEMTMTRPDAELALSIATSWRRYVGLRLASAPGM